MTFFFLFLLQKLDELQFGNKHFRRIIVPGGVTNQRWNIYFECKISPRPVYRRNYFTYSPKFWHETARSCQKKKWPKKIIVRILKSGLREIAVERSTVNFKSSSCKTDKTFAFFRRKRKALMQRRSIRKSNVLNTLASLHLLN